MIMKYYIIESMITLRHFFQNLKKIKEKLGNMVLPQHYDSKFKLAAQWYMNNSNLDDIK